MHRRKKREKKMIEQIKIKIEQMKNDSKIIGPNATISKLL